MNFLIIWLAHLTDGLVRLFLRLLQAERRLKQVEEEVRALLEQRPGN